MPRNQNPASVAKVEGTNGRLRSNRGRFLLWPMAQVVIGDWTKSFSNRNITHNFFHLPKSCRRVKRFKRNDAFLLLVLIRF